MNKPMTDKYAGHTEGEWFIYDDNFVCAGYGSELEGVASCKDFRNAEANARLIADAPKLLEENKRLREALEIAAATLLALDEHTHPSIECDAAADICFKALKESEDED